MKDYLTELSYALSPFIYAGGPIFLVALGLYLVNR